MLPFQPDDNQRVERKRHIGNDVVVLIFKEGNTPFDPLAIKSQFNRMYSLSYPIFLPIRILSLFSFLRFYLLPIDSFSSLFLFFTTVDVFVVVEVDHSRTDKRHYRYLEYISI